MKTIKLKVLFPYGWYDFRRLKIYNTNNEFLSYISAGAEGSISTSSDLIIKIDWYRVNINLSEISFNEKSEAHIILKFGGETKLLGLEYFAPQAIKFKEVGLEEFVEADVSAIYGQSTGNLLRKFDSFILIGCFVSIISITILNWLSPNSYSIFNYFCLLIAGIGLGILFFDREKTTINSFRFRSTISIGVLLLATVYSQTKILDIETKWLICLLLFTSLFRVFSTTISRKEKTHNKVYME